MKAMVLRLYMHESRRFRGMLLYEWLLEQVRKLGVNGGSAFRAVAGFGRHGVMLEQNFFELAGELPVVTEFVVSESDAERILAMIRKDNIDLMYVCWPAEYSTTGTPAVPASSPVAPAVPPGATPAPSASPGGTL
jgi:PII-like signaling protein